MQTERLVLMALLTALTAVLAYFGGFIKIGGLASISLTLIPVVLGSALCGPKAGAWLGGVAGAVFFITADAAFWFGLSIPGTVITVMVKGIVAGLCAGLTYKVLEKFNRYVAVLVSAIFAVIVGIIIMYQPAAFKAMYEYFTENPFMFAVFLISLIPATLFIFFGVPTKKGKK